MTSVRKNSYFTFNRDYSNKSRETKAVIYTCRYSRRQFNP